MKRLVICSDGTWNTPSQMDRGDRTPSNIVKIARTVLPQDAAGVPQVVFYDPGVGNGNWLERLTGGAFGKGLSQNVQDNYHFLLHNFVPGDEIYCFGFSRGAYTARSTAGLIRKCGLLRKEHAWRVPEAYDLYRNSAEGPDSDASIRFRTEFSVETRIWFIGVFDTVGALGIPISFLRRFTKHRYEFHDVELSRSVRYAYHAVAIDERRSQFAPTLWNTKPEEDQVVEQVWFPGVHSNIGGGYQDSGLSDIALLWMIEKAKAAGLAFDDAHLARLAAPNPRGELRDSRTGFFKWLRQVWRPIGEQERGQESVHESAFVRRAADLEYHPPNLEQFAMRTNPNRPSPIATESVTVDP
jgi:uncharacterized protein (DUF2235 family)